MMLAQTDIATAAATPEGLSLGQWALWWGLALVGIIGSALFSGLETGVYRLNRIRLHLLAQRPGSAAATLQRLVRNPNRMLGTLLYGNNIANYLASYAIAVMLAAQGLSEWAQVGINAAILTPLLFVFGEVLPKDLFSNYTDRLTYWFARFLSAVQWLLMVTGFVPLIDLVSQLLQRLFGVKRIASHAFHPRVGMNQLFKEGLGHGVLSAQQSDLIDRVLHPNEHTVAEAMTPWSKVATLRVGQPAEAAWALANRAPHSRFPLVDRGQVRGLVNIYDVLLCSPDECPPLESLARNVMTLTSDTTLRQALINFQREQATMAIVADGQGKPIGLVTQKDLVEPIVGELAVW